jgi:hypothetical protein
LARGEKKGKFFRRRARRKNAALRYRNGNINRKSIEIAEIEEGFIFYIQISSTCSLVEP